jgi:fumarate reductase iron-sulfur subunit
MHNAPTTTLQIFRYHPDHPSHPTPPGEDSIDEEPTLQEYTVPYHEDWVILDALNWIKDQADGALTFRWGCRMGVCGSCGMMVNGEPRLACSTFLREFHPDPIRVEPLENFEVQRDLVVELEPFMEKLKSVKPWIIRDDVNDTSEGEYNQSPAQLARFKQSTMCINCLLCYAACPEIGMEEDFIGPAALTLAHRYNTDSRDRGHHQRLDLIMQDEGVWGCTFVGECSVVCPKNVDPAGAIQQAKAASAMHYVHDLLMPKGAAL